MTKGQVEKVMKRYILKDTIINLKTLETQVWYTAKDGYVHTIPACCDGYTSIRFVIQKMKRDMEGYTPIDETHCLEGKDWLHHYEIIEIEQ